MGDEYSELTDTELAAAWLALDGQQRPARLASELAARGLIEYKPSFGTWCVLPPGVALGLKDPR